MPPWLIALLSTVIPAALFVVICILVILYFMINDIFEAKPLFSKMVTVQAGARESPETIEEETTSETESLIRGPPRSALPDPVETTHGAQKVWSLVDRDRAQVDVRGIYGSFSPPKMSDLQKSKHWSSPPIEQSFVVKIYNCLGRRVVQFEYSLQFIPNSFVEDQVSYLPYATIIPLYVSVRWGFKFKADIQISTIRNVGTAKEPIAAVTLDQRYQLHAFNTVQRTDSFEVRSDGKLTRLNVSARPHV